MVVCSGEKGVCSGRSYEEVDFFVLVTSDKVSLSNLESVGMTKIIWGISLTVLHIRNTWSVSFLDSLSGTILSSPERCLATMSMGHTKNKCISASVSLLYLCMIPYSSIGV